MRRIVAALAALAVGAVLVGAAFGAERFQRHAVPGQSVSLEVPASWVAVGSSLPQSLIDRISRQNPKLAPYLAQLGQPGSPMKFLALDPAVRNGFATNVNVVVVPVRSGTTFAGYRASLVSELRALVSGPIRQHVVTIAGARGLRVSYRFHFSLGGMRTVQTLQYGFLRGTRSVVVTFTTLPGLEAAYASTFARSAGSVRFSR